MVEPVAARLRRRRDSTTVTAARSASSEEEDDVEVEEESSEELLDEEEDEIDTGEAGVDRLVEDPGTGEDGQISSVLLPFPSLTSLGDAMSE